MFSSLLLKSHVKKKNSVMPETRLSVKALVNTANLIILNNLHSPRTSIHILLEQAYSDSYQHLRDIDLQPIGKLL